MSLKSLDSNEKQIHIGLSAWNKLLYQPQILEAISRPVAVLQTWMNASSADVTPMPSATTHQDPSRANASLAIKGMASNVCPEVRWLLVDGPLICS